MAGERFDATPIDAAVLTYRHQAAFAPRGRVAPPPATPLPAPPSPPPPVTPDPVPLDRADVARAFDVPERLLETGDTAAAEKPSKRRYRRRDLEPEA